ncbi:hypothetical protein V6N11_000849 [Hibiscus sabdariffa]|uniref:Uncharacterized protein n=1 Tax=Hibiscus sabdariffa TaxID=183260 RepID=A0ABR2RY02_9ROSI
MRMNRSLWPTQRRLARVTIVAPHRSIKTTSRLGTIGFEWASHYRLSSSTLGSKDLSLTAGLPDKTRAYSLCLASVFIKQAKRDGPQSISYPTRDLWISPTRPRANRSSLTHVFSAPTRGSLAPACATRARSTCFRCCHVARSQPSIQKILIRRSLLVSENDHRTDRSDRPAPPPSSAPIKPVCTDKKAKKPELEISKKASGNFVFFQRK